MRLNDPEGTAALIVVAIAFAALVAVLLWDEFVWSRRG